MFPGPGGYKIEWAPGAQHFDLANAPPGHLVIPFGKCGKVPKAEGGVPTPTTIFHARVEEEGGASSSSSMPTQ